MRANLRTRVKLKHDSHVIYFFDVHKSISPDGEGAPVGEIFLMEFLCKFLLKKGPSQRIRRVPGETYAHKLFKIII